MNKNTTKYLLIFTLILFSFSIHAQLYGGIEIGSKGIKMSVIDVDNIKKGDYVVKDFWTENIGLAKNISIDGSLAKEDIDKASEVVLSNYIKIKSQFKVTEANIFIVGSSGVAMANNTQALIDKIKISTKKS